MHLKNRFRNDCKKKLITKAHFYERSGEGEKVNVKQLNVPNCATSSLCNVWFRFQIYTVTAISSRTSCGYQTSFVGSAAAATYTLLDALWCRTVYGPVYFSFHFILILCRLHLVRQKRRSHKIPRKFGLMVGKGIRWIP